MQIFWYFQHQLHSHIEQTKCTTITSFTHPVQNSTDTWKREKQNLFQQLNIPLVDIEMLKWISCINVYNWCHLQLVSFYFTRSILFLKGEKESLTANKPHWIMIPVSIISDFGKKLIKKYEIKFLRFIFPGP